MGIDWPGSSDSPMWSRGNRSRSSSVPRSALPGQHRGRRRAGRPTPDDDDVAHGRRVDPPVSRRSASAGLGAGLVGRRVDLEGALEVELLAHLADGGDHLLAHEAQAAHRVVVAHGAVAVPEEDLTGAQVSSTWRIFGITVFGRAR